MSGLPRIEDYPLPGAADRPVGRVSWRIEPSRSALLIHDMQGYFVRAFRPDSSMIAAVVANIAALRAWCGSAGVPVFYSAQPGNQDPADRGLQAQLWGPGMSADSAAQGIVAPLRPVAGDIVLTKWRYSAFQRTPLESMLRARARDQLIVTGVFGHIGCLLTCAEAFMRDVQPFLVLDGVADFSRERHLMAAEYVAGRCGVVVTAAEVVGR